MYLYGWMGCWVDGLVGGWVSMSPVRVCGGEGQVRVNEWELVCAYTNFK